MSEDQGGFELGIKNTKTYKRGYLDGYTAGLERAAEIVEAKERNRYDNVGDPRVSRFDSYYAAAIRKEIGE